MAGTTVEEREAEVRRIEGIKKMTEVEEENRWSHQSGDEKKRNTMSVDKGGVPRSFHVGDPC